MGLRILDLDHDACYRAIASRDMRFDGQLFVGVRTTGIYCRPICPARTPRQENVLFYPSAAAAQEAGFRPCLRCRPECVPAWCTGWHGTSATVNRALALIGEGALDGQAVDELAARMGMGERQLRRLFAQHVGASPVAVAQTRRVFFARQLLAETRLPVSAVAMAAGFGSVRRFNATFQTLYRRPPSEMRRRSTPTRSEGITLRLPYTGPYDWPVMLTFLHARVIPGVEAVDASGVYHRCITVGGAAGSISVGHDGAKASLRVTIRFPAVVSLANIVGRVRRMFDLDADIIRINEHLGADAMLGPLVRARPGVRVPGTWDSFELAVRAILGQQIRVDTATALAGRLTATFGSRVDLAMVDPNAERLALTHAFPEPTQLTGLNPASLPMPGARMAALSSFARAVLLRPDLLQRGESLDQAVGQLCALPGIGPWTAQYIAMRALREPDAFPATDIGLIRALCEIDGQRPTSAQVMARAEAWRPWRAYAALHLWTSGGVHRTRNGV